MAASFSLTHHPEGNYFEIRLEGAARVATMFEAREQIAAHSAYTPSVGFIWDIRAASVNDVTLPEMLEAARNGVPQLAEAIVILWATDIQHAIGRQLTTFLDIDPDKLLFTDDYDKAVGWLLNR